MRKEESQFELVPPLPEEILRQVFCIRVGQDVGTAFSFVLDQRQYVVTAGHMFSSGLSDNIEIKSGPSLWKKISVSFISIDDEPMDIAILSVNTLLSPLTQIALGIDMISYGQPVRFLGFPHGLDISLVEGFRNEPLPFVKGGIISGFQSVSLDKSSSLKGSPFIEFYIDADANPGFSGGPLVLPRYPALTEKRSISWHLAGVVTCAVSELMPCKDKNGTVIGYVGVNSGIMRAISIDFVLHRIRENPVGYFVSN